MAEVDVTRLKLQIDSHTCTVHNLGISRVNFQTWKIGKVYGIGIVEFTMIFELLKFQVQVSNFSIFLSLGNAVSALQNGIVELGNGGKQMSRWCNQPIKMGNIGSIEPGLNTIKHMDFTKPRSTYFPNDHVRNAWRIQPPGYSTIAVGNVLPSHLQYSSKRRQEWQNQQLKIGKGIIKHYQPF